MQNLNTFIPNLITFHSTKPLYCHYLCVWAVIFSAHSNEFSIFVTLSSTMSGLKCPAE